MKARFQVMLVLVLLLLLLLPVGSLAQTGRPLALVLTASGPVAPAMAEYLQRGIETAERRGADVLIFQLDTPGGSVDLMNRMVRDIRSSEVPVVIYIAPRGAMAGSAGTVVTLAGHAAAMAPETAIGAASPVDAEGADLGETMEAKLKNALKATVRSLAERRSPEAIALAERTIDEAVAVSANEALEAGLVDFIAGSTPDLLDQLDGFTILIDSEEAVLNTAGAELQFLDMTFIEQFLAVLANPNLVFLLLAIGFQAVLIEISNPGGWIAGFIGVVSLALATYGLGILPVNWFGAIFLVTAFALFILDIKAPTHGALTAAGVASLIIGALVMFNPATVTGFPRISIPLVVATSVITGGMFFGILLFALRAQRSPIRTGRESLAGRTGMAVTELNPRGLVQLGGEQWSAELVEGAEPAPYGARVRVERVEGLRLIVRRVD